MIHYVSIQTIKAIISIVKTKNLNKKFKVIKRHNKTIKTIEFIKNKSK